MYSKYRFSLTATDLFASAAAALALMTGVLAVGMSTFVHSLNDPHRVSINFQELSWWSGLRVAFDLKSASDLPASVMASTPVVKTQIVQAAPIARKAIVVRKKALVRKRVILPVRAVVKTESLSIDQAELNRMQSLHQLLRSRFVAAVNTQTQVDSHLLAKSSAPTRQDEGRRSDQNQKASLVAVALVETKAAPVEQEQKPVAVATIPDPKPVSSHPVSEVNSISNAAVAVTKVEVSSDLRVSPAVITSSDTITQEMAAPAVQQAVIDEAPKMTIQPSQNRVPEESPKVALRIVVEREQTLSEVKPSVVIPAQAAPKKMDTHTNEYSSPVVLGSSLRGKVSQPRVVHTRGYSPAGYSQKSETPKMAPVDKLAATPKMATAAEATVASAPLSNNKILNTVAALTKAALPLPKGQDASQTLKDGSKLSELSDLVTQFEELGCEQEGSVIEAFQTNTAVIHRQGVLSYEGPATEKQGRWLKTSALEHWTTLSWQASETCKTVVPVISGNTAAFLARLAGGAPLQQGAGIVFGRIPRGWNVEFSGRSETVVYLDERNQLASHPDQERTFALVNAAPGAQFVYLVEQSGLARASVAIPVIEEHATYIDLRSPVRRDFNGTVFDASGESLRAVPKMVVRVVGQPGKTAATNKSGEFQISGVYTFARMPLFVETLTEDRESNEYVHRYRVSPTDMHRASLFRFGPKTIFEWLEQLEEGISNESGLVVAAFPLLAQQYETTPVKPVVRHLLSNATLLTETYTLSTDDYLMPRLPIGGKNRRMVSVQISDGPVLAELWSEPKTGPRKPVWSELLMSSPRVVNVLGPW